MQNIDRGLGSVVIPWGSHRVRTRDPAVTPAGGGESSPLPDKANCVFCSLDYTANVTEFGQPDQQCSSWSCSALPH